VETAKIEEPGGQEERRRGRTEGRRERGPVVTSIKIKLLRGVREAIESLWRQQTYLIPIRG
jgi:hypothetical protein